MRIGPHSGLLPVGHSHGVGGAICDVLLHEACALIDNDLCLTGSYGIQPGVYGVKMVLDLAQSSKQVSTDSQEGALSGSQLPPKDIREIVDAPPTPALSFSSKRDEILFLQRRSLPPIAELAKPEVKLGDLRIDPDYNSRIRISPHAQHLAFSVRGVEEEDGPPSVLSLWIADVKSRQAYWSPGRLS